MSLVTAFMAAPPVSRTMTALTLGISLSAHAGLISPQTCVFYIPWVFKFPYPELWRLITSFFFTAGSGIIFDTYFLWTYSSGLEKESSRFSQPGDFFTYVIFLGAFILAIAGGFLQAITFISALNLGLAYTYSQDNRGKRVSFYFVTFNVIWLPWALLGLTFLLGGGPFAALVQSTGLLAAHAYDFLTRLYPTFGGGRNNIIQTPTFVRKWFSANAGARRGPGIVNKGYGTAYQPQTQPPTSSSSSSSATRVPTTQGATGRAAAAAGSLGFRSSWGQGRRLGGD